MRVYVLYIQSSGNNTNNNLVTEKKRYKKKESEMASVFDWPSFISKMGLRLRWLPRTSNGFRRKFNNM